MAADDFVQFNIWFQIRLKTTKKTIRRLRIFIAVLAGFLICFAILFGRARATIPYVLFLLAAIYLWMAITYPTRLQKSVAKNVRNIIAEGKYGECFGPTILELRQNDVWQERDGRVQICPYAKILEVLTNANCVYLMVGTATACIVPFSAFASEGQIQEFVKTVKQRAGIIETAEN